jgi:ribosomal protein S12 methylthiotransferase
VPTAAALADVVIVNTCGFIDAAKEESLTAIFTAAEAAHARGARVAAVGCLVERYRDDLGRELPEADLLCGFETDSLVQLLADIAAKRASLAPSSAAPPARRPRRSSARAPLHAYVKISDGCDRRCSYCAVPLIKGAYETVAPQVVLDDARAALAAGARELVLVGQDTSRYMWPGYGGLERLLGDLAGLEPLWLRVLYLQPDGVTDEVLDALARHAVAYVDVPLQHAAARVLRAMRRTGDGSASLELLARIRAALPGVAIRSTFITGFPGETEADVDELVDFVRAAGLAVAGVFAFDPQEGTVAATLPRQVAPEIREERAARVAAAIEDGARGFWESLTGECMDVLIEDAGRRDASEATGRIALQAPDVDGTTVVRGQGLRRGQLVRARVEGSAGYNLMAVVE